MSNSEENNTINWLPDRGNYIKPLISICVPTFNRCEYLDYLLNNIICEIGENSEKVEVVISDNCSTDKTYDVARKFQDKFLNLKYSRSYKNFGLDRNIRNSVVAASGKFCWLMGDDDAFCQGATAFVAGFLEVHNPDIAISDRYLCDSDMSVVNYTPNISDDAPYLLFDCIQKENMIEYFLKVKNTGGMFNFLSTIVVRRESWLRAPEIPGMSKSLFPHLYKFIDILRNQGGKLLYLNKPTVLARVSSRLQELTKKSEFREWQIHFGGNIEVADHFFSDDPRAYNAFVQPIRNLINPAKQHYINLAVQDNSLEEAILTMRKLNIEYP